MSATLSPSEVALLLRKPRGRVRNIANKADRTYGGRVYMSKSEALKAFELDHQKARGEIFAWTPQVHLPIRVNGVFICKVILDFGIQDTPSAPMRFVEVKGWRSAVWILKEKLLRACYPDIDLVVERVK